MMRILIDQCVPRKFLRLLNEWGYDARLITDTIAANASDSDVITLALHQNAVLLTLDLDFANIIDYPPRQYNGIVVIRYDVMNETPLITSLKQALSEQSQDELRGKLMIIEPHRYRIRKS